MTETPDPGLTDLIAAHRWDDRRGICECMYSPEFGPGTRYERMGVKAWAAHVALVVEQHTNGRAAKLAEAVQGMWRLITKLDETSDGLGDWHDATEYIDWARKEVQEIYVRAALEGEQQ